MLHRFSKIFLIPYRNVCRTNCGKIELADGIESIENLVQSEKIAKNRTFEFFKKKLIKI